MNDNNKSGAGVGFGGLLTLVFIVLKLTHVINWSWVWVLSPIWITTGIVLFIILALILLKIFS